MARFTNGLAQKREEFAYKAFQNIPPSTAADVQLQLKTVEGLGSRPMGIGPLYRIKRLADANLPLPIRAVKLTKPRTSKKVKADVSSVQESAIVDTSDTVIVA